MAVYRDNRLVPLLIIAACTGLFYCLLDTTLARSDTPVWFGSSGPAAYRIESVSEQTNKPLAATTATTLFDSTSTKASAASIPTPVTDSNGAQPIVSDHGEELLADDILLIMRTGGATVYRRLLVHLTTSLSAARVSPSNAVIYSDYAETIGDFAIVDALANLTSNIKSNPEFSAYTSLPQYVAHNVYQEASNIEGDDYGPTGGWVLDKYKFLPMMQHAGKNWPRARWYVYMEDDTYLFLPNVLSYLSSFNSSEAHYLGSLAYKSNVTFAHGGSGFALSRKAWEMSFGQNPNLVDELDEYTLNHGCGDQILGYALNKYGVTFGENNGDEKFSWGFNPVVHWRYVFSPANWCKPLLSWHKVHGRDVARFYEFEKKWKSQKKGKQMLYRDFFKGMIVPDLAERLQWWDNMASLHEITSNNPGSVPPSVSGRNASVWTNGWISEASCKAACEAWADCMQWNFYEDRCRLDDRLMMGSGYAPGMSQRKTSLMTTSGWLLDRLQNWDCGSETL